MNREQFEGRIRFAPYENIRSIIPGSLIHSDSAYEYEKEWYLKESIEGSWNKIEKYVLSYTCEGEVLQIAKDTSKELCCINMLLRLFDDGRLPQYTTDSI